MGEQPASLGPDLSKVGRLELWPVWARPSVSGSKIVIEVGRSLWLIPLNEPDKVEAGGNAARNAREADAGTGDGRTSSSSCSSVMVWLQRSAPTWKPESSRCGKKGVEIHCRYLLAVTPNPTVNLGRPRWPRPTL